MSGLKPSKESLIQDTSATPAEGHRLRLLSYNIQVGIDSIHPRHYLTKSWKHVFPASKRFETLDKIARLVSQHDVVGLQELDSGSHRTNYVDLTEYLANKADYPFWYHQLNRNLGRLAQHGNGLLSRFRPSEITEHKLPGMIPGRGALLVRYGHADNPLAVIMLHLALSTRARARQLGYVAELLQDYPHAIVMGDLNCAPDSVEMRKLFCSTGLCEPVGAFHTFPSWKPARNIDHILVSSSIEVIECSVLNHAYSDHLPISMEVKLPEGILLG
ncbi:MAG: endonuclease/exonuclease/phosphatase family protein [Gammaproteobacteria bacterium]|nr:endonuclease/exonuclease/phosphatase family protein [Gammaproteobacteria bacterium]